MQRFRVDPNLDPETLQMLKEAVISSESIRVWDGTRVGPFAAIYDAESLARQFCASFADLNTAPILVTGVVVTIIQVHRAYVNSGLGVEELRVAKRVLMASLELEYRSKSVKEFCMRVCSRTGNNFHSGIDVVYAQPSQWSVAQNNKLWPTKNHVLRRQLVDPLSQHGLNWANYPTVPVPLAEGTK